MNSDATPRPPPAPEDAPVPEGVRRWIEARVGADATRGYGYTSWVFMSRCAVIRVDRAPGRSARFDGDRALSGLALPGVAVPEVVDEGVVEGRAWIETTRLPGEPAYLRWPDMGHARRQAFMERLLAALEALHRARVAESLVPLPTASWAARIGRAARAALADAAPRLPGGYRRACEQAIERGLAAFSGGALALVHGDLWFGNLLVDANGALCGLVDFDRLARAPRDFELDMLLRFWRYPWNFVPAEWEAAYAKPLDFAMVRDIAGYCADGLSVDEAEARLSVYDLAYRLRKVAQFGWSDEMAMMLDWPLKGDWRRPLGLS